MGLSKEQLVGVCLLVSLVLFWVPIPFIEGKSIASILLFLIAIYLLLK